MIGEHLKAADRFIKASEFPKALEEVTKALGVESNNMYALAYNERIKVAIEAAKKKEEEDKLKKLVEDQKKAALPPKPAEPPRAPSMPDAKPLPVSAPPAAAPAPVAAPIPQITADDMVAKIKKEATETADKKADERLDLLKKEFESARRKLEEDVVLFASQAKDAVEARTKLEHTITEQMKEIQTIRSEQSHSAASSLPAAAEILRVLFEKAWEDGAISPDERSLLQTAQSILKMSDADFSALESSTRSSSYLAALREVWKDGVVTPEEAEHLEQLRKALNVTGDEHLKLESQIRKESAAKKQ
ncbi:MAG: hypothetical protein NTV54_08740 [Ignavibacteriales bacterium]|nr:hypothetical protein [Ignavibacteriales bacterium]